MCWHNLAVAERPRLWAQGLDRSTPLLKGQSRAVFPSSRVSAASPRARTLNSDLNLAVAERPRLWAQGLDRSTPLLKGQSRAVFPSSRVSAASPRARTLNSGRLAQPCFWHFGGQRALDHLLGWEREGSTNCTLET